MKIKAKNPKNSSMQLIVPVDGLITIDANGVAEVSAKCAVVLVTSTNDWEYMKKKVENSEEEDEDENGDGELSEREQFIAGIKDMSLQDMKNMANEAEYPSEEWEKLTSKKLMYAYLLKKYDEVSEKSDEVSEESDEEDDEEEK